VSVIQRGGGQALRRAQIGAIFIEFALAIPVLIAIIYYLHDISKYKRMQAKMNLCTHEVANILQNISQGRIGKKITKNDIRYALAGAYLTVFPGKSMYTTLDRTAPMGYVSQGQLYCVRGNANGTANVLWCVRFHNAYDCPSPLTIVLGSVAWESLVKNEAGAIPSVIYPELKIQSGETKIIVECAFHYYRDIKPGYKFTDGRYCQNVSSGDAFGFYALNLQKQGAFFRTVVIFTPKPGLFDATAPK
jgi:Flp pilus assembly protein TadG